MRNVRALTELQGEEVDAEDEIRSRLAEVKAMEDAHGVGHYRHPAGGYRHTAGGASSSAAHGYLGYRPYGAGPASWGSCTDDEMSDW